MDLVNERNDGRTRKAEQRVGSAQPVVTPHEWTRPNVTMGRYNARNTRAHVRGERERYNEAQQRKEAERQSREQERELLVDEIDECTCAMAWPCGQGQ